MKYHVGDNVVFINNSKNAYDWNITEYKIYKIYGYSIHKSQIVYSVKFGTTIQSWYSECDFMSLKEYRKLKIEKINKLKNGYIGDR